ncbi:hypothetical protein BS101_00120 [Clostridium kluyveri]|uniref:Uncharacterized protein n=1 Tax=Clostridium kluyveri TaxID=1534 RepID=A0A1L5F2P8_CLOKL|nr:hypothetical protein BS101_00120 [Clostridium kluyveri]
MTYMFFAILDSIPYTLTSQSKKIGYKLSIEHIIIVYIFVYYLTVMLSFTGIRSYIENILLFIPLEFMLPCIWKKYEVLLKTAFTSMLFVFYPFLISLLQFVLKIKVNI